MDYGKAFTFMFEDPNWVRKLVIGTLVVLIGIILSPILIGFIPLLIVAGYILDLIRNVTNRQRHPLPEWEDWGGMLVRGIKIVLAFIIWALPLIVLVIPSIIGGNLTQVSNNGGAQAVGALLLTCVTCLSILWGLFITLLSPAIMVRLAAMERFASAFEVGALWKLTRDHIGPVIIALLLTWLAGLIAGIVGLLGIVLCIIGLIITIPLASLWQYLVMGHLFGQIGAEAGYGPPLSGLEPLVPLAPEPGMADISRSVTEPVVVVPVAPVAPVVVPPEPPVVVPPVEPPPPESAAEVVPPAPPTELPPPEPPVPPEPPAPPAA